MNKYILISVLILLIGGILIYLPYALRDKWAKQGVLPIEIRNRQNILSVIGILIICFGIGRIAGYIMSGYKGN